jgi:hypothetical protein
MVKRIGTLRGVMKMKTTFHWKNLHLAKLMELVHVMAKKIKV